jgi:nucleoredoxin
MDKFFNKTLLKQDEIVNTNDYLQNKKNIGIYFSKLNCAPCVEFTKELTEVYNKVKNIDKDLFEVVFISFDIMENLFQINYNKMPFLSLSYLDYIQNDRLKKIFKVNAIPNLIILNNKGEIIIQDGESLVKNNINNIENIINILNL